MRDMLAALDRQAKQAAAVAAEQLPGEQVVALRLGQRVVHRCAFLLGCDSDVVGFSMEEVGMSCSCGVKWA
jgi:hypothetical protein